MTCVRRSFLHWRPPWQTKSETGSEPTAKPSRPSCRRRRRDREMSRGQAHRHLGGGRHRALHHRQPACSAVERRLRAVSSSWRSPCGPSDALPVDLHLHSLQSDGTDTPAEVVAASSSGRARCYSPHRSRHARRNRAKRRVAAQRTGIRLIPGTELSVDWPTGTMHMLVYFLEPGPGPSPRRARRCSLMPARPGTGRILDTARRPRHRTSTTTTSWPRRAEASSAGPTSPHLMVERGHVADMTEAFDRWLATRPARLRRPEAARTRLRPSIWPSPPARVPVIAHPHTLGVARAEFRTAFEELAGCRSRRHRGALRRVRHGAPGPPRRDLRHARSSSPPAGPTTTGATSPAGDRHRPRRSAGARRGGRPPRRRRELARPTGRARYAAFSGPRPRARRLPTTPKRRRCAKATALGSPGVATPVPKGSAGAAWRRCCGCRRLAVERACEMTAPIAAATSGSAPPWIW